MAQKYPSMTKKEKEDWYALDDYVRHNVMGYTDQGLNKRMVYRLKGLRYGQYIANNNARKCANYSFKTILNTFKACSLKIKNGLQGKHFTDENQKFNYIMAIIDNNIADVRTREIYLEKSQDEMEKKDIETPITKSNYKPKAKEYKFSDLW